MAILGRLPQIAIAAVGLILVHNRLKGPHPRAFLYGSIGLGLLLAEAVLGASLLAYIQGSIAQAPDRIAATNRYSILNASAFVIRMAALALMVAAIVADRGATRSSRNPA